MLVLFETTAGFALFKLKDDSILDAPNKLYSQFERIESAKKLISLNKFCKFNDIAQALTSATALIEGKLSSDLKRFLKNAVNGQKLAVADLKLASNISKKLQIECIHNASVMELMRCIRFQIDDILASDVSKPHLSAMKLGLAHSLSRYKIKFSPDKVDTMIVQAIGLLDDLDKELNIYVMRAREWYGYHFPELIKIVPDNLLFSKVVKVLGHRTSSDAATLMSVVDEELANKIHAASKISMGTDVSQDDMNHILELVEELLELSDYRGYLWDYLKNRMLAIAPNLTLLVGELLGARLIAHAGSLINLAKCPASTIQIMGAEKALFRAIKASKPTPKYGYLFHASLVGQATPKHKGKISRIVANKAALAIRVDALGDVDSTPVGGQSLQHIQQLLIQLEHSDTPHTQKILSKTNLEHYQKPFEPMPEYNPKGDFTLDTHSQGIKKRNIEQCHTPVDQDPDDGASGHLDNSSVKRPKSSQDSLSPKSSEKREAKKERKEKEKEKKKKHKDED